MKHAAMQVWKEFANDFLAPWWHSMYPGGQFHVKPSSFPSVQAHLLILHRSYPSFQEQLSKLLSEDLAASMKNYVRDLEFLFEYAIPTVLLSPCKYQTNNDYSFHVLHVLGSGLWCVFEAGRHHSGTARHGPIAESLDHVGSGKRSCIHPGYDPASARGLQRQAARNAFMADCCQWIVGV